MLTWPCLIAWCPNDISSCLANILVMASWKDALKVEEGSCVEWEELAARGGRGAQSAGAGSLSSTLLMQFFLMNFLSMGGWRERSTRVSERIPFFPAKSYDECRKTQLHIFHVSSVGDILGNVGPHVHVQTYH